MKKLEKQDEMIIQNKIDGTLSAQEEKRFKELISTSAEARRLYQSLLNLHLSLKHDSKGIPSIDFSHEIMETVEEKRFASKKKRSGLFPFIPGNQFPAYAALLLVGLFIGSMVTYLAVSPGKNQSLMSISGTMAKTSENESAYQEAGTVIKVREFESGEFSLLTVAVNTIDSVYCTIPYTGEKLTEQAVNLLFSSGKFELVKETDRELSYLCIGNNIFIINKNIIPVTSSIRFIKRNKLMYQIKPT
jgi:hypothetical protein